ncbi:Bll5166 protein [hydrothermal vent metagenome]|uniref:Bll5166 protein n=1 Tax=hydrothermal vent metagenome TaxID=652676 RepID=A0A1W1CN26_9ZZZZ
MDLTDLLQMGAKAIQGNSDDATTELDIGSIGDALGNLLGGGADGGLDLSQLVSGLSENGLGATVSSWLGSGENEPISIDSITDLLGSDKISEFANSLGLSEESAKGALADALPNIVDKATSGEDSIIGNMLSGVGGVDGAMDMLGKMFR